MKISSEFANFLLDAGWEQADEDGFEWRDKISSRRFPSGNALAVQKARDESDPFLAKSKDIDHLCPLRAAAQKAGAASGLILSSMHFMRHGYIGLGFDAGEGRGPIVEDDLDAVRGALRAAGWRADVMECDDEVSRVCAKVPA